MCVREEVGKRKKEGECIREAKQADWTDGEVC